MNYMHEGWQKVKLYIYLPVVYQTQIKACGFHKLSGILGNPLFVAGALKQCYLNGLYVHEFLAIFVHSSSEL